MPGCTANQRGFREDVWGKLSPDPETFATHRTKEEI